MAELKLRVAAHGEMNGIGDDSGATSTANWWAHATKTTRAATHRDVRLAKALDADAHEPVRRALAAGEVVVDQAAVIVRAVDALSEEAEAWVGPKAQRWLLDQAAVHDAKHLNVLGKRILEVVDPEAAVAHEAKLLEQEELEADAAAMFRMHDDGHGRCHGKFTISSRHAAMLRKALLAKAAPRHQAAVTGHAPEPGPADSAPDGAGVPGVHRDLPGSGPPEGRRRQRHRRGHDDPRSPAGWDEGAQLDTGENITAAEAGRMACAAGVIPAVLDGKSKVLDLGRKQRFHSESQRIVATVEQGGCTAEGCDWPPGMSHLHHPTPWSQGGGTNRDGRLLCPRHHTLAHDLRHQMTVQPTGKVSFHRRR